MVKQEVRFGLRSPLIEINVSDVIFSSPSIYTFVREGDSYRTVISRNNGTVQTLPSNGSLLEVPLVDFHQEKPEIIEFTLPNYNYGSYYTYTFQVTDEYISGIRVFVKMPESDGFTEYNVEKVKYLIDPGSKTVFFNQTASDTYVIEFGNGLHGSWIPGAEVRILLYKTIGVAANFSQDTISTVLSPTQLTLLNKMSDGSVVSSTLDPKQYLKVNFKYSEGGIDPLAGESLRRALVNYIQTRDNFVSEDDFYNIVEKYTTDFRLLFKKMLVQENNFYLQRALRDEYKVPVRSMNIMPSVFSNGQSIGGITYYSRDTGELTPGLYFYKICAMDRFGNKVMSDEVKVTLTLTESSGSIFLKWAPLSGAEKYVVYGRTADYERYWELSEPLLVDDGTDVDSIPLSGGVPEVQEYPYVLFPEFISGGQKFTSPFLFKFNEIYNYYEGWLFYPELIVNFASLEQTADGEVSAATVPSIFLNLIYDQDKKVTSINLKSYQQINEWNFTITIPELGIERANMEMVDESTFTLVYDKNDGYIIDPIVVTIYGSSQGVDVFSGKTSKISQRYDITDLLQIPIFIYNNERYLVDLPVLESDTFNSNKVYYLDKILKFLIGFNFTENRMVSDNLEFRFLNTDSIRSYLLSNCLVQGKNLYKNINFLKSMNPISIADSPDKIPLNGETWIIGSDNILIESTEIDGESLKIYQESGFGGLINAPNYKDTSPYSIVLNGDYTSKISPLDIVRVKDAVSDNINGLYHVLNVVFEGNKTVIYVLEKLSQSLGEGKLYYASYEQWRKGGPDNFAKWDRDTNSWVFTQMNVGDAVTVRDPIHSTFIYTSKYSFEEYALRLPLNLSLKIFVDRQAVNQYAIDLEEERKTITLELAKYLQLYMTGTDIVYYPSQIIEFVSEERRHWIKGMYVITTDSTEPTPYEFRNGIEALPEYTIRDNISSSKLEILKYTSAFYWWNVDNIKITYELNGDN